MQTVTIRLEDDFHRNLKVKLAEKGTTFQFVVTQQLKRWLNEQEAQQGPKIVRGNKSGM